MKKMPITLVLVSFLALSLSGCIYSRELARTGKDIERESNAKLDRQVMINVGAITVGMARGIMKYVDDEDVRFARHLLGDIRRMKMGLFEIDRQPSAEFDVTNLARFEDWEVALKVRDEDDHVYLMYREHQDSIREIFLFVFEEDHLVVAKARGNLNHVVSDIIREYETEIAVLN